MARVTVEDCILVIPNRFELVILAAQRAKAIALGSPSVIPRENDKPPVLALREIAGELVDIQGLRSMIIKKYQRHQFIKLEDKFEEPENIEEASKKMREEPVLARVVEKRLYADVEMEAEEE